MNTSKLVNVGTVIKEFIKMTTNKFFNNRVFWLSVCQCVLPCVRPCVRAYILLLFARCLKKPVHGEFHRTLIDDGVEGRHEPVSFWRSKGQGRECLSELLRHLFVDVSFSVSVAHCRNAEKKTTPERMMKIIDMFFFRRRRGSNGSTVESEIFAVEDRGDTKTVSTVTTVADCVRPLLTSMKLFGLYFRCGTEAGDKVTREKPSRRWNGYMIYGLVVATLLWINVTRIFSVFKNILLSLTCLYSAA